MKIFLLLAFLATPALAESYFDRNPLPATTCYGCGQFAPAQQASTPAPVTGGGTRQYNNALERIEAVTPKEIEPRNNLPSQCITYPAYEDIPAYTRCR